MKLIRSLHPIPWLLGVVGIVVVLFISSCNSRAEDVMLPMKAGHRWRYLVEGDVDNRIIAVEIVDEYVVDGVEWFHVEGFLDDFLMLRNTPQGVYHTTDCDYDNFYTCTQDHSPLKEEPLYRLSANEGERYGFLDWPDSAITVRGERDVRVPSGTLTCTIYEFNLGGDKTRHCVAPGIGVVLVEETWYGNKPVTLTLLDRGHTDRGIDEWVTN